MITSSYHIIGYNTNCRICIFPTLQEKQKTKFLAWEWFLCFKILTSATEYDKTCYPSVHSLFHALCYHPIWWNFSAVLAFFPNFIEFRPGFSILFLIVFFSCWLPVLVLTKYSKENDLPCHFRAKSIWLIMISWSKAFQLQIQRFGLSSTLTCILSGFW